MAKKDQDYATMSLEQLSEELISKKTELSNSKLALLRGELSNTGQISRLKKQIAKILTIVNQMEIEEMGDQ